VQQGGSRLLDIFYEMDNNYQEGYCETREKKLCNPPPKKNIRKYFSSPTPFAIIKTTSKIRFPPRDGSLFMWVGAGNKLGTFLKSEKGVFN